MPHLLKSYPRVLVVASEPFNMERGCGITLSNLFKDWPADKIMGAYWLNIVPDYSVCAAQHRLENSWPAPMKLLAATGKCPLQSQSFVKDELAGDLVVKSSRLRKFIIDIDRKIGLSIFFKKVKVQKEVKESIKRFKPQLIYCVLSGRDAISVTRQLFKIEDIPLVIHVYDDWIARKTALSHAERFLHVYTESCFKALIRKAGIRLAIGDFMCRQYEKRYGEEFLPFQNSPDPELWLRYGKNDYSTRDTFCFRFTGNIYNGGNLQALLNFSNAIEIFACSDKQVSFEIYTTPETIALYSSLFAKYSCTRLLPTVLELRDMASLCGSCDSLVMVCNFDESGSKMLGMSMPTKMPTSMLSGAPLFVYAPANTAMTRFVVSNDIGYVVSESLDGAALASQIEGFVDDAQARESRAKNARRLAMEKLTSDIVRPKFQNTIRMTAACETSRIIN